MSFKLRPQYIVICEGKSEVAYLTELSKFFQENDINVRFNPRNAGSGIRSIIEECLKKELEANKKNKDNIFIFLDEDIYLCSPEKNTPSDSFKDMYYFNTFCFEDFLVLHLEESQVKEWDLASFNIQKKYRNDPNADWYTKIEELLVTKGIFSAYKKGELPKGFNFSFEMLKRLIANCNNSNIKFKSDFVTKILSAYRTKFTGEN